MQAPISSAVQHNLSKASRGLADALGNTGHADHVMPCDCCCYDHGGTVMAPAAAAAVEFWCLCTGEPTSRMATTKNTTPLVRDTTAWIKCGKLRQSAYHTVHRQAHVSDSKVALRIDNILLIFGTSAVLL